MNMDNIVKHAILNVEKKYNENINIACEMKNALEDIYLFDNGKNLSLKSTMFINKKCKMFCQKLLIKELKGINTYINLSQIGSDKNPDIYNIIYIGDGKLYYNDTLGNLTEKEIIHLLYCDISYYLLGLYKSNSNDILINSNIMLFLSNCELYNMQIPYSQKNRNQIFAESHYRNIKLNNFFGERKYYDGLRDYFLNTINYETNLWYLKVYHVEGEMFNNYLFNCEMFIRQTDCSPFYNNLGFDNKKISKPEKDNFIHRDMYNVDNCLNDEYLSRQKNFDSYQKLYHIIHLKNVYMRTYIHKLEEELENETNTGCIIQW